jgi:site-specific DNA recombinase
MVSQEPCELVQANLAHNQRVAARHNKAHDDLLRALISCGRCRLSCMARPLPAGYAYYTCRGRLPPSHSCREAKGPTRFIPANQLDALVWRDLCAVVAHPTVITQALQRAQGGHWLPQALQARREQLRKGRVHLAQQLDRLTEAYLVNVIPLAEYQRRRHALEQRMQAWDTQAQRLEASADRQAERAACITSLEDVCQRVQQGLVQATFTQKRHLVELLIDRVVVTNEDVEIRYVIPTRPRSEHIRFCPLRKEYLRGF